LRMNAFGGGRGSIGFEIQHAYNTTLRIRPPTK
jgi:hypothetical protein